MDVISSGPTSMVTGCCWSSFAKGRICVSSSNHRVVVAADASPAQVVGTDIPRALLIESRAVAVAAATGGESHPHGCRNRRCVVGQGVSDGGCSSRWMRPYCCTHGQPAHGRHHSRCDRQLHPALRCRRACQPGAGYSPSGAGFSGAPPWMGRITSSSRPTGARAGQPRAPADGAALRGSVVPQYAIGRGFAKECRYHRRSTLSTRHGSQATKELCRWTARLRRRLPSPRVRSAPGGGMPVRNGAAPAATTAPCSSSWRRRIPRCGFVWIDIEDRPRWPVIWMGDLPTLLIADGQAARFLGLFAGRPCCPG